MHAHDRRAAAESGLPRWRGCGNEPGNESKDAVQAAQTVEGASEGLSCTFVDGLDDVGGVRWSRGSRVATVEEDVNADALGPHGESGDGPDRECRSGR